MRKSREYALYKGDEFIDLGTMKNLSIKTGIKLSTMKKYRTDWYKERSNYKTRYYLILLEDDNE